VSLKDEHRDWTVSTVIAEARRMADAGEASPTLAAIGKELSVSRQRVRQIETGAVEALQQEKEWLAEVRAHVEAALRDGPALLATLAADPWWAGIAARPEVFNYFGVQLLEGRVRIVELGGEPHLARWPLSETVPQRAQWVPTRRRRTP
jgi:hypothetical protein